MRPKITETHKRELFVYLDRHELGRIIGRHVGDEHGMSPDDPDVKLSVDFVNETEGSPSYRVGTAARVTITRDLSAVCVSDGLPQPETPTPC